MDDVSRRRETIVNWKSGQEGKTFGERLARTCPAFRLLTGTCADV